ncbi:MAG TPA: M28 family peptidase, partial [Candidatus Polarisedimenticolia bacterium]|nr:M28 family peptidase [Candidatus Polarisedimenticolia bacterium]
RIPVFGLSYNDGRLLRESLQRATSDSSGGTPRQPSVSLYLQSKISEGRPRTVVGTLPGAGASREEIVIVCAHGDSDSGGPGADDNASGVAALIETARALTTASARGLLPAERPTLRFVVWGSEYHSSRAYVGSHASETRRFRAVFNYDEAGTGAERDALYFEGNDIPHNADLLRSMEAVAEDHAGKPGFWTTYSSVPALGGTDAYAFLPKSARGDGITDQKIPTTTVFTAAWDEPTVVPQTPGWKSKGWPEEGPLFVDYSRYYHSSGDTPERTTDAEPYNMERCARMVAITIVRMMRTSTAPAAPASAPRRGGWGGAPP